MKGVANSGGAGLAFQARSQNPVTRDLARRPSRAMLSMSGMGVAPCERSIMIDQILGGLPVFRHPPEEPPIIPNEVLIAHIRDDKIYEMWYVPEDQAGLDAWIGE